MMNKKAIQIDIFGIVQGVGFRPFLYNSLLKLNFFGTIQNRGSCVRLVLEGKSLEISNFIDNINKYIPPLAKIEKIHKQEIKLQNFLSLEILTSEAGDSFEISVPEDLATCSDCLLEFYDPNNRRYHYPFIACTNCGPRYTVVKDMPYDRKNTTLIDFPLCDDCLIEYVDPKNRRFHAESMACKKCGPSIWMEDSKGHRHTSCDSRDIADRLTTELDKGNIIALRALGGFQLICDARNSLALNKLRQKKQRPDQSFALMAKDIEAIKKECLMGQEEENILKSCASPILILNLKKDSTLSLNDIAPDLYSVGVMLPTTPLHHLFFGLEKNTYDFLVVTSGNSHGQPIAIANEEARDSLSSIADCFILHNRQICRRADDSVATISDGKLQYWRSGRGIAPLRMLRDDKKKLNILALGPQKKNTVTLSFEDTLITSPHLGTLDNPKAASGFVEICEDFPKFYKKNIDLIAVDMHPAYFSTQHGKEMALKKNIPCIAIQHHHAHAKAVMAEHNLNEAIAIIFDGTGYGEDGTLWGGELLHVEVGKFSRLGHLLPFALPGGNSAINSPWRTALSLCDFLSIKECSLILNRPEDEIRNVRMVLDRKINSPLTSSMGRLFDAVSAILGIAPDTISYEGQAAIRLEKWASSGSKNLQLPFSLSYSEGKILIDPRDLIKALIAADKTVYSREDLALSFHCAVAKMILDFALEGSKNLSLKKIVLSGGVFQNKLLVKLSCDLLRSQGFTPYISERFSPGDGQISLGQAVIAREWCAP